jgi:PAS domain S-box-containing protein
MAMHDDEVKRAGDLRRMAEAELERNPHLSAPADAAMAPEDIMRLLHELSVQQIELEMQREEMRREELAWEASLARYVDLYDSAPVGYCTLDDGVINEANLAAANMLGVDREALIGQPMTRFIHSADLDIYQQCRQLFSETDETQECELRMLKKGETVFWAHVSAVERRAPPPRAGSGAGRAPVRLVLIDVTARKRSEDDKARLEGMLQQAQKLKTLGVLAGGMAHDFNNLLATIVGNANLSSMTLEPESKVMPYLVAIEKAAMRAAKLTRQMLAYSGQGKYLSSEMDLNVVLTESLQFFSGSMSTPVNIHVVLSDRLPYVQGDTTQISEVVINLLTNAVEALDPGREGRLIVRTRAEHLDQAALDRITWVLPVTPGHFATLEVADEGIGMPPDVVAHLFEPFFSTKFTGRGLGLAEVIGVVRNHGGGIQVQSEPGQGSCFKIFLPAMRTPRSSRPGESVPGWRGEGRILVVDDEEEERNRVRRMAEELGLTVIEAAGAMEAVDIFRLRHGDLSLVLLDLTLPSMDGRETLKEIHRIDSSIPVVLGSPHGAKDDEVPMEVQAGVLGKPYRLAEFRGLVQRALA